MAGELMNYFLQSTPNLFIETRKPRAPPAHRITGTHGADSDQFNGSTSGFLPPTMLYVTYDVVRHARTTSYVRRTTSCWTLQWLHARHRTCDIQDVDVQHRKCDIVRHVRCRTSTYNIVHGTYDILRAHLHISYTMSYVGNGYTHQQTGDYLGSISLVP